MAVRKASLSFGRNSFLRSEQCLAYLIHGRAPLQVPTPYQAPCRATSSENMAPAGTTTEPSRTHSILEFQIRVVMYYKLYGRLGSRKRLKSVGKPSYRNSYPVGWHGDTGGIIARLFNTIRYILLGHFSSFPIFHPFLFFIISYHWYKWPCTLPERVSFLLLSIRGYFLFRHLILTRF